MKRALLAVLRLDERPTPPPGFGPGDAVFRASRRQLGRSALFWAFKQLSGLLGLLLSLAYFGFIDIPYIGPQYWLPEAFLDFDLGTVSVGGLDVQIESLLHLFEAVAIFTFLAQLAITGLLLKLSWELRWYMIGEDSIRIREGLWTVHEQTMTISNIQNLIVRQGPIEKLLGIGDLEVHTAGGGAKKGHDDKKEKNFHVGLLRGLDDPWRWRDHLRARLSQYRDSGLGAREEAAEPETLHVSLPPDLGQAAVELRDAARALRLQWTRQAPNLNDRG